MPEIARRTRGSQWLMSTSDPDFAALRGLAVSLSMPLIEMHLFIAAFCACYLWAYVGGLLGAIVFLVAWLAGRRAFLKKRQRLQLGGLLAPREVLA